MLLELLGFGVTIATVIFGAGMVYMQVRTNTGAIAALNEKLDTHTGDEDVFMNNIHDRLVGIETKVGLKPGKRPQRRHPMKGV